MKCTIEDVAKLAGVSITTVSRVINNNYPVKKETRRLVEEAIKELGFQPNPMARGLIIKKSKTIGIVVPSITNMFFTEVIHGLERSLKDQGYDILLSISDDNADMERECVEKLLGRFVDGIIVVTPFTSNIKKGFFDEIGAKIPLICINGYSKDTKVNFVLSDQEKGAMDALDYLLLLGHTRIAFVRGGESYSYDIKQAIYESYMERLGSARIIVNIEDGNSIDVVKNTTARIMGETCKQYELGTDITAFLACNDLMAAGVLNACGSLGVEVPDQISIIGFDNIMLSEMMRIKMTTVDLDMTRIGAEAAEGIVRLVENGSLEAETVVLGTRLVVRESCMAL